MVIGDVEWVCDGTVRCVLCSSGSFEETVFMYVLNAGLPKRLPPLSSGGQSWIVSSRVSRIWRIDWMIGRDASCDDFTEEMESPRTESDNVKIHETISVYVGEARKSSWSCGDRIRLVG